MDLEKHPNSLGVSRHRRIKDMPNNLDLKYRPKTFKDLVGKTQRDLAKKVSRLIENGPRPQRILLYGPPGVGKTSAARIIQSCYMCEGGVSSQPCGDCIGCKGQRSRPWLKKRIQQAIERINETKDSDYKMRINANSVVSIAKAGFADKLKDRLRPDDDLYLFISKLEK
jgi:hypothetical protein